MKEIKLTKGFVAFVDDEDFERVNAFKWCVRIKSNTQYAIRGVSIGGRKTKTITMHQFINKADIGYVTDHIDRNGLNNQKSNLRTCTQSENCMNRKTNYGSSKYKGVSFNKKLSKYVCYIRVNKKIIHFGCFEDEKIAAKSYDLAAIKYFGEFANINFSCNDQL